MALYFASNLNATTPAQQSLSSAGFKTLVALTSQTAGSGITLSRAFIYEFEVGVDGLAAAIDGAITYDISAVTSVGTSTTGVVSPLDPADAASSHVSSINSTAEPTTTANSSRWTMGMNQRASYRWVVNPGGPGELVVIATNLNGLTLRAKPVATSYAATAVAGIYFRE